MAKYTSLAKLGCWLLAASALQGCTTELKSFADRRLRFGAVPGVLYRLPSLQYVIAAKFTLVACKPASGRDDLGIELRTDVKATEATIEGEARVLDYSSLSSHFKTSAAEIRFFDGTKIVESINASVTDHGPEVASNVAKSAFGVARLAMGLPSLGTSGGGGDPRSKPNPTLCTNDARDMVEALDSARKAVGAIPDRTKAIADRLATLTVKAQLGSMTAADKREVARLLGESRALEEKFADLQEAITALEARLTFETEWRFPDPVGERSRDLVPPVDAMVGWLRPLILTSADSLKKRIGEIPLSASLVPAIAPVECDPDSDPAGCKASPDTTGYVYREPEPGLFKICATSQAACVSDPRALFTASPMVPQFGALRTLLLRNGWGQDNELVATFNRAGSLLTIRYAEKSAPAAKAAVILAETTDQVGSLAADRQARDEARAAAAAATRAASAKADIDDLQHRIDVLQKQADLAELQARLADPSAREISSEAATLKARVELLQLRKQEQELMEAMRRTS